MKKHTAGWMVVTLALVVGLLAGNAWAVIATGGNATNDVSGYRIHMYTNTGSSTFSVSDGGSVEVLVVAGGGGGGSNGGGGGGAGGVIYSNNFTLVSGSNYTVTVGGGGAVHPNDASTPTKGGDSVFGTLTAFGGGGGTSRDNGGSSASGGSGGGGAGSETASRRTAGAGTAGQGTSGGTGIAGGVNATGGGGGGAGTAGINAASTVAGNGGTGVYHAVFSPVAGSPAGWFAGGGGGGRVVNGSNGTGGQGGGGAGGGVAGTPNTGGGGGGGGSGGAGPMIGGSGIVIVRYPSTTLWVSVTSPTSGQGFLSGSSISATATLANGTSPYTVTFYTNYAGGAFASAGTASSSPYTVDLGTLATGTYGIYATVTDNLSSNATSSTNTFSVVLPPSSFFWTNTGNGNWNIVGNWTNATGLALLPDATGQTNYTLNFNQAGTYTATHNLDNGFLLNQLNFGGATATLAGNSLAFTNNGATLPQVNQNNTAAVTINTDLILGTNVTFGGSSSGTVTVGGALSGVGSLTKAGTSPLTLSVANSYSGATTISGGSLALGNLNAIANSTSVSIASGTSLRFPITGTYVTAGTISIAGTGLSTLPGAPNSIGALWFGQGGSYASTLNAPITLGGATTFSSYGNNMTQTLGGAIGGTGPLTINSTGGGATDTGVWTLNAASSYSGNTIIKNGSGLKDITVKLGIANALPVATSLDLTGAANTANAFATLDLNGFDQTLAGLTDSGSSTAASFGKRVINSSGTLATLTINNAGNITYGTTAANVLAGTIGGLTAGGAAANNLALTKTGAGTLALYGANTYSGGTSINAGTLQLDASAGGRLGSGTVTVAGSGGANLVIWAPSAVTLANNIVLNGTTGVDNRAALNHDGGGGKVTLSGTVTLNATSDIGVGGGSWNDMEITGVVSGIGGMIVDEKNSGGDNRSLTLSGANTYTGPTTVTGGTLLVNNPGSLHASSAVTVASGATLGGSGTINGTVNVSAGGMLSPGASSGTIGQLTLTDSSASALTLNGNTLNFDLPASGTTCDLIAITGNLVLNGVNTLLLNVPAAGLPASTSYTLMTFGANSGAGTIVFPNGTSTMGSLTLTVGPGSVTLDVGAGGYNVAVWKGSVDSIWDTSATNWTRNGSTGQQYVDGDAVTFDDTATAGRYTVSGGGSPSAVTVNNSANAYIINAAIGGTGTSLTKSGSQALTLGGANTFTGGITINGGNLTFSSLAAGMSGTGKNVTFGGSATLVSTVDGYSGGILDVSSGTATINPGSIAFSSTTGSGNLVWSTWANRILNIGNASTFTGTLKAKLMGNANFNESVSIQFSSISDAVGSALQFEGGTSDSNQAMTMSFNGTAPLTFNNRQIQILPRTQGNMEIRYNTLANNSALAANKWVINTDLSFTGVQAREFRLSGSNAGDNEFRGVIGNGSGQVSLVKAGTGKWILSGTNTFSGTTTISGGTLQLNSNLALQNSALVIGAAGSITLGSGITTPTFGGLSGTVDLVTRITSGYGSMTSLTLKPASGSVTYSGIITEGAAGMTLTKSGAGTQVLSGVNTYTGGTTVNAGILRVGNNSGLPSGGALTVNGGTADLVGYTVSLGNLNGLAGTSVTNDGNLTVTQVLAGEYAGVISGSGSFTKAGAATLTLSGTNAYTGTTTISAGTLVLGAINTIAGSTNIILTGGTLDMGSYSNAVGTLAVTGTSTIALGSGSLSFANSSGVTWTHNLTLTTGTLGTTTLRFGTTSDGLTVDQLESITINGCGVSINRYGYIVSGGTVFSFR